MNPGLCVRQFTHAYLVRRLSFIFYRPIHFIAVLVRCSIASHRVFCTRVLFQLNPSPRLMCTHLV